MNWREVKTIGRSGGARRYKLSSGDTTLAVITANPTYALAIPIAELLFRN
jgi:hypothetical protein